MTEVEKGTTLTRIEHILGSGTGTLDFAIEGENGYSTWEGSEDANWIVKGVERVENDDEDRFLLYPEDDYFICDIKIDEEGQPTVYCESN